MKQRPYVRASYLEGFESLILAHGGSPQALMRRVGLEEDFDQPYHYLVSLDRFVRLLDVSAQTLDYPNLSLDLALSQDSTVFGPLCNMLSACDTLGGVLDVMVENLQIQVAGIAIEKHIHAGTSRISVSFPSLEYASSAQLQVYILATIYTMVISLSQEGCPLRACHFPMLEPADTKAMGRLFKCPMAFSCAELALVVDDRLLDQKVNKLSDLVTAKARSIMSDCSEAEFLHQVESVMASYIISGRCTLKEVATVMSYSPRSLQRRLQENGSSFHGLLNGVKARLAQQFIQQTCYRLTDIAAMLGYKQLSSFSRSYQRWYGEPPSAVSREQA